MKKKKRKKTFLIRLAKTLILYGWRKGIGKIVNKKTRIICRFHPSCSEYGIQAINKYGITKGVLLTIKRIKRCNPYNTNTCIDYP